MPFLSGDHSRHSQYEGKVTRREITEDSTTDCRMLDKKKATKRRILSLVGQLQHATKVVKHGRTFVARLYSTAAKVRELDFYTRLNMDFRPAALEWNKPAAVDHT